MSVFSCPDDDAELLLEAKRFLDKPPIDDYRRFLEAHPEKWLAYVEIASAHARADVRLLRERMRNWNDAP